MLSTSRSAGWLLPALFAAVLSAEPATAAPEAAAKHEAPVPAATVALMQARKTSPAAPILIRIYKKEAELEVWKRSTGGRFVRLKTYPICRWSGQLGPKLKLGDRQAPEGFYSVAPSQMNPKSAFHLSFDTGFPNAYDRAQGSDGSALMVHGACVSAGCFAMTNEGIAEIYALAREAFTGGQKAFQLQAFPFRMNTENLVRHRLDPNIAFWRQLKEGSDRFEATREELVVTVSAGRYAFKPATDPEKEAHVAAYRAQEEDHGAVLLEEGRVAVRTTYEDGGQHAVFLALTRRGVSFGEVGRPQALALAGREIVIAPARPTRLACAGNASCMPSAANAAAAPVATPAIDARFGIAPPVARSEASTPLFSALPIGGTSGVSGVGEAAIPGSLPIVPPQLAGRSVRFAAL